MKCWVTESKVTAAGLRRREAWGSPQEGWEAQEQSQPEGVWLCRAESAEGASQDGEWRGREEVGGEEHESWERGGEGGP